MPVLSDRERGNLEDLVDVYGLEYVVSALEEICYEKEDHLRSNWQDEHSAALWHKAGKRIGRLSAYIRTM